MTDEILSMDWKALVKEAQVANGIPGNIVAEVCILSGALKTAGEEAMTANEKEKAMMENEEKTMMENEEEKPMLEEALDAEEIPQNIEEALNEPSGQSIDAILGEQTGGQEEDLSAQLDPELDALVQEVVDEMEAEEQQKQPVEENMTLDELAKSLGL